MKLINIQQILKEIHLLGGLSAIEIFLSDSFVEHLNQNLGVHSNDLNPIFDINTEIPFKLDDKTIIGSFSVRMTQPKESLAGKTYNVSADDYQKSAKEWAESNGYNITIDSSSSDLLKFDVECPVIDLSTLEAYQVIKDEPQSENADNSVEIDKNAKDYEELP